MCMSVLEGGIYFDELLGLPSPHLVMLALGLVLALLGAIFMGIAGYVAGGFEGGGGPEEALLTEEACRGCAMPWRACMPAAGCPPPLDPPANAPLCPLPPPSPAAAEKPEHIFHYSAAASELSATDGGPLGPPGALSPPPLRGAAAATVQVRFVAVWEQEQSHSSQPVNQLLTKLCMPEPSAAGLARVACCVLTCARTCRTPSWSSRCWWRSCMQPRAGWTG